MVFRKQCRTWLKSGEKEHAVLEYLIAVDAKDFSEVEHLDENREIVLLTVVRFHEVRLLDNLYL